MTTENSQKLHSLIKVSLENDIQNLREKYEEERKHRISKKAFLDNADINAKMLDVLRLASSASDKVAEEIFDKLKSMVFGDIKKDLEEIAEQIAIVKQQRELSRVYHERHEVIKNKLAKMNKKLK